MEPDDETPADIGPHAFLLRIHVEPREVAGAPPRVRVWVRHLPSGEARHMTSIDELVDFLAALSGTGDTLRAWARRP